MRDTNKIDTAAALRADADRDHAVQVTVIDSAGHRHAATIAECGEYVTIPVCPACGSLAPAVRGTGITHHDHDTYYARGLARCCGVEVCMETKVDTIFGIDEDQRMLNSRYRVY